MKKKHILYSAILSMGMAISSCSDYLNVSDKLEETTQNLDKIFMSKEFSEQWLAQAYAYLITRVRDKDCVKNRVKRAKIVRFTLC